MFLKIAQSEAFFHKVFPFSFIIEKDLKISFVGRSLKKLFPNATGKKIDDIFTIIRPAHSSMNFEDFTDFLGQIFIFKSLTHSKNLLFRGEFIHSAENEQMIFLGSPWLTSPDDLKLFGLNLTDFALHDSVTDMLQVLKMKDAVADDIRMLNEKLEESELRYRELVELGSDSIYKLDSKGVITFVNEVFCNKTGYDKNELSGRTMIMFIPDDWQKTANAYFSEIIKHGCDETYIEFPMKTHDGGIVWFGQHTQIATTPEGEKEVRCFAKDITERKIVEQNLESTELRLGKLISTLHAGILVEDQNRKVILANPYFCDLFGYPGKPEELIGADCAEFAGQAKLLFEDPESFISGIDATLRKKEVSLNNELKMADGRILECDFIPITSGEKYLGHLWQYRDLTEKKKAELNLITARKEAEAARDAEKQFLAHMSHEIRTPLNAILGMLHLMKETELTNDQQEFIKIQEKSTLILSKLINDILDISKVDAGKIEISATKVDINALLEDQYKTFNHQVFEKSIELNFVPIHGISEYLWGDGVLINQIMYNLIGNAVKFTNEGSVEIKGELVEESSESAKIKISVTDTGIGIPDEKKGQVFERFRQLDQQTSIIFGGTGLGLAITKKIVDLLNGKIELESTVGEGSCFSVTLELKKTGELLAVKEIKSQALSSPNAWEHLSFLAAEDNTMNTFYLKRILKKTGVQVDFVVNGAEAVEMADKKQYDLILMDIRMPVMDGISATKLIRQKDHINFSTPILALTASAFKTQVDKVITAGTNDFLPKPFTPAQLLKKIQELLPDSEAASTIFKAAPIAGITISKTALNELYGDDYEFALDMYNTFLEGNYLEFIGIKAILEKDDFSAAREAVHRVKPSFSMIGMPELQEAMKVLENLCVQDSEDCLSFYNDIAEQLEQNLPKVKAVLMELGNA